MQTSAGSGYLHTIKSLISSEPGFETHLEGLAANRRPVPVLVQAQDLGWLLVWDRHDEVHHDLETSDRKSSLPGIHWTDRVP
ncbi:hypothetical protein VTJ04DRAFT_4278 [Mycothermus thermophilus]|uniref:uncharacterized protein n=1 Tax=Humicola insolens TaxID=85995 RepID=UPI003742C4FF